ncbi:DUF4919 domain-containing protein [Blastopirellula sp. JC732]|uniref:DUF4919 domain-containing protein n=1 Tax=Blastopirellula sediminis TaxID=2894196 RepID=A0A9X1SGF0_9BACT|nr:DUF4919 domain-containing protein [Blastopirellula sediminis]MCC9606572.1 DUF4919 domain-containing protein [Blastopirellula sediminis]MCC9630130.1 DUF4919 domain-containing protein [Blastopirellula sediminis]
MREMFMDLLKDPSAETYLPLRSVVMNSETYDPYSDELNQAEELTNEGKLIEAVETIGQSMPNLLLSPSAHMLIAFNYDQQGKKDDAEFERFIAIACCKGILATGEGTQAAPYQVLRTSDEYDVLMYLGKQFAGQALVEKEGRYFDKMKCSDEEELWFEITELYSTLSKKMHLDDA